MEQIQKKWVESMLELETLKSPYQMDMCWMKMQGYINPPIEVFQCLFRTYAYYGRVHEFSQLFDDLNRCYQFAKPNAESWNYFVKLFCNLKSYYFADLVITHMKNKKIQVNADLLKEVEQGIVVEEQALPVVEKWLQDGQKGDPPEILKYGFDYVATKEREIIDTVPQSIQPPLEWLVVKEVKEEAENENEDEEAEEEEELELEAEKENKEEK